MKRKADFLANRWPPDAAKTRSDRPWHDAGMSSRTDRHVHPVTNGQRSTLPYVGPTPVTVVDAHDDDGDDLPDEFEGGLPVDWVASGRLRQKEQGRIAGTGKGEGQPNEEAYPG